MSAGQPMWRLVRDSARPNRHQPLNVSQTYSPAPESGIRSTLQPNSPIYQTATESEEEEEEEEEYLSVPNSPPQSSPVEDQEDDSGSDAGTPIPEPVLPPPLSSTGPSRIYLRVPPLDPKRLKENAKSSSNKDRRKSSASVTESSATPSAMSSRQNSQNLSESSDTAGSPGQLSSYFLDERGHKRYPCLRCDKQFGRSHDRKRHMEESTSCRGGQLGKELVTEAAPMWVCERCGDSFSRRDSMNRHMKNPDACKAYKRLVR